MSRVKRLAGRAARGIIFLLILAAMVLFLNKSLMLMQEDNLCPRYYKYPEGTFDVTFLGASLVMYGVYPLELYEEYGMAAYNLSTGNQSPEASYYLAKESIERDHPSLIVMDCGRAWDEEETMKSQYIHYITDTMPWLNKNRIDMIWNLSEEGADHKPLLFPLIAYHTRWEDLTWEDAQPQTKELVYGCKVTGRVNETEPFEEPTITSGALSTTSRMYIERTIELCRENDTELLLITMPVPGQNEFFDQHGYDIRMSAAMEVAQLAEENGVQYVNYLGKSEELGLDLEMDAYDGEHLNRWGAAKFTKILGGFIKDHYDIPDRRSEGGAYAAIQEDLEEYPVNRMRDSLTRTHFLRDYACTLKSDLVDDPVEDILVLITLNGQVDDEILSEERGEMMQEFGLKHNLHDWKGHGWMAVFDNGELIYETEPREGDDAEDFADQKVVTTGKLRCEISSGRVDEETGEIHSAASIRVNGMEYASQNRGLHFAVFRKSTGELLDSCWLNIFSHALSCTHDNH